MGVPSDKPARDPRAMARSLSYLFSAGAMISLLPALLPNEVGVDSHRLLMQAVAGFAIAALLALSGARLPLWSFQVFLAAATMLVEWTIWASGDTTSPFAAFYFWIAIYAFHFFTRREADRAGGLHRLRLRRAARRHLGRVQHAGHALGDHDERPGGGRRDDRHPQGACREARSRGAHRRAPPASRTARASTRRSPTRSSAAAAAATRSPSRSRKLDGYRPVPRALDDDPMLARVGEVLRGRKRAIDIAARISADEVAVIAPGTDEHGAYLVAERMREAVRSEFARPVARHADAEHRHRRLPRARRHPRGRDARGRAGRRRRRAARPRPHRHLQRRDRLARPRGGDPPPGRQRRQPGRRPRAHRGARHPRRRHRDALADRRPLLRGRSPGSSASRRISSSASAWPASCTTWARSPCRMPCCASPARSTTASTTR